MELALEQARIGLSLGEVPVGAVIVYKDEVIGVGHNTREGDDDISGHAEINALKDAGKHLGRWQLDGASLYVTLEPCLMCAGAIRQSRVSSIVFGASDPGEGAVVSKHHVFDADNGVQTILGGVMKEECEALLNAFFAKRRN